LKCETAAGVGTPVQDVKGGDGEDKGLFGSSKIGNMDVKGYPLGRL